GQSATSLIGRYLTSAEPLQSRRYGNGPVPIRPSTPVDNARRSLVRAGGSDLRCTHRFGHAKEDRHTLTAAARRERFFGFAEATVDVLPVVHHPNVARG